ncbi:HNH endonuclease signature motif containing protein [Sphingobium indicum]|uniref:HNH endonuclease signature motif containing protein n=2 Tax=Sphingobium indicum TaxID=332055 RepID=UPI0012FE96A5|nr:HNH endonuclease signature motif containing protein [Sphingobium indicum]
MAYRGSSHTLTQIASRNQVTIGTALQIVKEDIPADERRTLKSIRYAASKMGQNNPASGKHPPNHKGQCSDGRGYLTEVVRGKRYFVHRIIMAKMIGIEIENLPDDLHVHHIDGDKLNNHPDNLALVTSRGHRRIHKTN